MNGSKEIESGLKRIIAAFARHEVDLVVVGAFAAQLQDYDLPAATTDVDLTPLRETANLARVSDALDELGAQIWAEGESFPFSHDAASLERSETLNLVCPHGRFDIAFAPSGGGFEHLAANAETVTLVVDGKLVRTRCADIDDIIASKSLAGRPKDGPAVLMLAEQAQRRRNSQARNDTGSGRDPSL